MPKPRRRFWRTFLLAVGLGVLSYVAVEKYLEPQPLFEVALRDNQTAFLYFGHLVVTSRDGAACYYRLNDGAAFPIPDGQYYEVEQTPQPSVTIPVQRPSVADLKPHYYLGWSLDRKPVEHNRYILFDPDTRKSTRFHGYHEDDRFNELIGKKVSTPSSTCLLRRPLPFDLLFTGCISPHASPASELLNAATIVRPVACPSMLSVITIPDKKLLSRWINDGRGANAQPAISPTGQFVVLWPGYRNDPWNAGPGNSPPMVWNVQQNAWMGQQPDPNLLVHANQAEFVNGHLFVADTSKRENDNFALINLVTGQPIDYLFGVGPWFFANSQCITAPDGCLYYLALLQRSQTDNLLELRRLTPALQVESVAQHRLRPRIPGVILLQGLQSVHLHEGRNQLSEFLKKQLGNNAFYRTLEPIVTRSPSTLIHDWQTGYSCSLWNGSPKMFRTPNGEHLIVVHQTLNQLGQPQDTLAQVYHMPMTIFSLWWSRGVGLAITLLILLLLSCLRRFSLAKQK